MQSQTENVTLSLLESDYYSGGYTDMRHSFPECLCCNSMFEVAIVGEG